MDLNQLLYHHQVALIHAARAPSDSKTLAAFDLVRHYGKRLRHYRERHDLPRY